MKKTNPVTKKTNPVTKKTNKLTQSKRVKVCQSVCITQTQNQTVTQTHTDCKGSLPVILYTANVNNVNNVLPISPNVPPPVFIFPVLTWTPYTQRVVRRPNVTQPSSVLFSVFSVFSAFWQLLVNFANFLQLLATFWEFMTTFANSCQFLPTIIVSPCHLVIRSSCYTFILPSFHPVTLSVLKLSNWSDCEFVSFTACASWSLRACYY